MSLSQQNIPRNTTPWTTQLPAEMGDDWGRGDGERRRKNRKQERNVRGKARRRRELANSGGQEMSDGSISQGQCVLRVAKPAAWTHNSPRALLPTTGRHHTSKVRPEADVIALQQFVHNLFHHRNIPSGWAERQKKRVLVILCAIGYEGGVLARQHHHSIPTPKHLRVLLTP